MNCFKVFIKELFYASVVSEIWYRPLFCLDWRTISPKNPATKNCVPMTMVVRAIKNSGLLAIKRPEGFKNSLSIPR